MTSVELGEACDRANRLQLGLQKPATEQTDFSWACRSLRQSKTISVETGEGCNEANRMRLDLEKAATEQIEFS